MKLIFGVFLLKHLVKCILAVMANTRRELFDRGFERGKFENIAAVPNAEIMNMTTCTCRNFCSKEKGRNFCPCRGLGKFSFIFLLAPEVDGFKLVEVGSLIVYK